MLRVEKYFKMKKGDCKEALEIYKRFLTRVTKIGEFMKMAEVQSYPQTSWDITVSNKVFSGVYLDVFLLLSTINRLLESTRMTFLTSTM